jgi:exonuclease III
MHWNCNSLLGKFIDFAIYVEEKKPDIILLNEVKSSQEIINSELHLKNYSLINKTRKENPEKGGGVAVYIKLGIVYDIILDFEFLDLELICLKIKTHLFPIHLISYYNPPNQVIPDTFFEILSRLKGKFIIGGDLNS